MAGVAVAAIPATASEALVPLADSSPVVLALAEHGLTLTDPQGEVVYSVDAHHEVAGSPVATTWIAEGVGISVSSELTDAMDDGRLALSLVAVEGPGELEIIREGSDAPPFLSSLDGGSSEAELEQTDVRTTWEFSGPGRYVVTLQVSLEVAGVRSSTEPWVYQVDVTDGATSPTPAPSESTSIPEPTQTPQPTATPTAEPTLGPAPLDAMPVVDDSFVDSTVAPVDPLPAPDVSALTDENRGAVTLGAVSASPGSQVTFGVPIEHAEGWVSAWMERPASDLGWKQITEQGAGTVTVPSEAAVGANRVIVRDREGGLIGWASIEIAPTEAAVEECIPTPVTTTIRPDNVTVISAGHLDLGPVIEGGQLRALLKDDRTSPALWVDPGTIVMHVGDAAAVQSPGGPFSFLGTGTVWQIPLTQNPNVPWLGWNTQHPTVAGHSQGDMTLTLEGVEGPGGLAVYSLDSFGGLGARYFGTVDGFPRSTAIPVGTSGVHVHGIWAFTEPGAYYVTVGFSGTVDGQPRSGTSILTFFVGAGDPTTAVREQTVTTYVGRTPSGKECTLTLAQTGFVGDSADMAGMAGALVIVGLAFLGASALAPRRRQTT